MKKFRLIIVLVAFVLALAGLSACSKNVKLSFNTNGGEQIASKTVKQQHVFSGFQRQIGKDIALGWFDDKELTIPSDASKPVVRNMTLYAKWQINQYTMSFITDSEPIAQLH